MSRYHICHAYTTIYCEAFTEVADLLAASLRDLGHECTIGRNKFSASARNILLGGNMLKASTIPEGIHLIVYQLEQLWEGSTWWNDDIRAILKRANEVWDYDPANIAFMREHLGIEAKHVIIGYHKDLIRVPRREQDIDVLHVGSMNERRSKIISEIEKRGVKVTQAYNVWGRQRDELFARAKVVLNLHYYEAAIFEQVRVSYLLNNGVWVVSESSDYEPYSDILASSYEDSSLALRAAYCVESQTCGCDGQRGFRGLFPMTEILRKVIEHETATAAVD